MILNFGKHRGRDIREVPREYIEWLIETKREELETYEAELARRDLAEEASQSVAERIIQAGFRALAMKTHPDQGGDANEFRALKAAQEQLKEALEIYGVMR